MDNKGLVQRFRQLLDTGKFREAADLMSDDIRWWVPRSAAELGFDRPVEGREAVVRLVSGATDRFYRSGSMRREYHCFVAEANLVSSWFTMSAVTTQGEDYTNDYHFLLRCEDGRIAEVWEHLDTAYSMSKFMA
jgi:ketosteroid isomerase-like protein